MLKYLLENLLSKSRPLWEPRDRLQALGLIKDVADGMSVMLIKSHPPHIRSRGGTKACEIFKNYEDHAIALNPESNQ